MQIFNRKQRFSIRKLTVGVVSVLTGIILTGTITTTAYATEESSTRTAEVENRPTDNNGETNTSEVVEESGQALSVTIEATENQVVIRTESAANVSVTVDGEAQSVNGKAGIYSFTRPSNGGTVSVTATDSAGKSTTKELKIQPVIVDGVVKPIDTTLDVTNQFNLNGITPAAKDNSESQVLNAGTEFKTIETNNSITLTSTSWTRLPAGWKKDGVMTTAGHFILAFQNPTFYQNIENITIKATKSSSAEAVVFQRHRNGSYWTVEINNKTLNAGAVGTAYDHPINITMKNGKTLRDLGLADKPISFTSGWVTGTDYPKQAANLLVKETIDQSWFKLDMPNKLASDNGYDNAFAGTNAIDTQPTLKALPRIDAEGNTTNIDLVYQYKPVITSATVNLNSNTFQQFPRIVQNLPVALLPYIDTNEVYLYQSNATGAKLTDKITPVHLTVDQSGRIDTIDTRLISTKGLVQVTQKDVDVVRTNLNQNVFNNTAGQLSYFTISYKLKEAVNEVEFAKKLNDYIQRNNEMLLFETWLERTVMPNLTAIQASWNGNKGDGVLKGTYTNAYLDTNLLLVDAEANQTYSVAYPTTIVKAGSETQPQIPTIKDAAGKIVNVPEGSRFAFKNNAFPDGVGTAIISPETGAVSVKTTAIDQDTTVTIPVVVTYPDGTNEEVFVSVEIRSEQPLEVTVIEPDSILEYKEITPTKVVTTNKDDSIITAETVNGLTVDKDGNLVGMFSNYDWGKDEEERIIEIPVTIKNGDEEKKVIVPVKVLRDTDRDGNPDITDPDDDGDGYSDEEEKFRESNPKDGSNTPHDYSDLTGWATLTKEVYEHQPTHYEGVVKPQYSIAKITSEYLHGLTIDSEGSLVGVAKIDDWGKDEESRLVDFPFTLTIEKYGIVKHETVPVEIVRDTDGDGIPDYLDPDDDNDGVSDEEEKKQGTDPKDPNSKPEDLDGKVTTPDKVVENQPVTPTKVVTPNKEGSNITSEPTNGLSVDKDGNLTGTPTVDDWGKDEEERTIEIPVTIKNGDEETVIKVSVTVQRDSDKDGQPDVTDLDDDNDGVSDEEEKKQGTDPKDPNSKPADLDGETQRELSPNEHVVPTTTDQKQASHREQQMQLPHTGTEEISVFGAAAIAIISGLGLTIPVKKKEE